MMIGLTKYIESSKTLFLYSTRFIFLMYCIIIMLFIFETLGLFSDVSSSFKEQVLGFINTVHYFIKVYVSLFLIVMYNPYLRLDKRTSESKTSEKCGVIDTTERNIIFNSGVLLFLSVAVIDPSVILHYIYE